MKDLEAYGRKVWLDKNDLVGGESWWPEILKQIRTCDVFVFAVSANSLDSDPCNAEYDYAKALSRPILPVEIGDVPEAERRNYEVFSGQLVDYKHPDNTAAIALIRGLGEREGTAPELPDPLPPEPPHWIIPAKGLPGPGTKAPSVCPGWLPSSIAGTSAALKVLGSKLKAWRYRSR